MSNDVELAPVQVISAPDLQSFNGESSDTGPSPVMRMHLLLLGRYRWFFILAAVLSVAFATVGFFVGHPIYQSDGLIRVAPYKPQIMWKTDENNVVPMFDSLVDSQVTLIRSSRVIDMAVQSPDWKALNRGSTPQDYSDFLDHLLVGRVGRSEHISVSFLDRDPAVAMAAVKSVIEAYMKVYGDQDVQSLTQRLQVLDDRRTSLNNQLKGINDRIMALANDFGSDSLDHSYDAKLSLVEKLENNLQEVLVQLATTAKPTTAPSNTKGPAAAPDEFTVEQIAASDTLMRDYLKQKEDEEFRLSQLKLHYGTEYKAVQEESARLDMLNSKIARYVDSYRRSASTHVSSGTPNASAAVLAASRDELLARKESLSALLTQAKSEMLELGRKNLQIKDLKRQADDVRQRLDETKQRIDQLNVESATSGRITPITTGDLPGKPSKDPRKNYAAAGVFGGLMLALGIMLLVGARDPGLRNSTEAKIIAGKLKILGNIPVLPRDLSDPEQAAIAAHGVHHIRAMLQLIAQREDRHVLAITSPASGTGKTSLTLSLGVSMAATGSRTLLIDCDLIGAGLTARINTIVRRKIGRILQESGAISPENLQAALSMARKSRKRLGEMLIELGFVEQAKLTSALAEQGTAQLGILDAMGGEPLSECVADTGIPGLSILAVGSASSAHAGQLSPTSLRKLLVEARKEFDVVLIDTGPILGSLEASLVAAAADGVVLTMSRGEQRPLAERAVDHLHSIGANVIGIVFNRAENRDTQIYSTASMSTQLVSRRNQNGAAPASDLSRFGPIALAVAASVPETNGHSESKS